MPPPCLIVVAHPSPTVSQFARHVLREAVFRLDQKTLSTKTGSNGMVGSWGATKEKRKGGKKRGGGSPGKTHTDHRLDLNEQRTCGGPPPGSRKSAAHGQAGEKKNVPGTTTHQEHRLSWAMIHWHSITANRLTALASAP